MRKLAFVLLMPLGLYAQQLAYSFTMDTNVYYPVTYAYVFRGPLSYGPSNNSSTIFSEKLFCFQNKSTKQYDIFSLNGKIGSIAVQPIAGNFDELIWFSQTFINNDAGWEEIVNSYDTINDLYRFRVLDESGNQLLSDSGQAYYGFDGQSTYVYCIQRNGSFKAWRFRSNVASSSPQALSKTAATPGPMMTYMPSGDLRVNLQPAAGGTSIQIFDMLGRQLFNETIQNINKPTTFNIPVSGMPNSPFVAKVNNSNGWYVKKGMPVR